MRYRYDAVNADGVPVNSGHIEALDAVVACALVLRDVPAAQRVSLFVYTAKGLQRVRFGYHREHHKVVKLLDRWAAQSAKAG